MNPDLPVTDIESWLTTCGHLDHVIIPCSGDEQYNHAAALKSFLP